MDAVVIKKRIEEYLLSEGVDAYGYCSARPFDSLTTGYLKKLQNGHACSFEFRRHIDELILPSMQLEDSKSFLVMLLPYLPYDSLSDTTADGYLASGCATLDYHTRINDILSPLSEWLLSVDIRSTVIVDTTPLSDRALAVRSGLGMIRRNNMFYHPKYGSYVFIGALLMDYELHEKDIMPITDPCGHCRRCVAACPGGAILGDGVIDSNKCVSWLTQKKELTDEESNIIGQQVYGCDVCQKVCPINRGIHTENGPLVVNSNVDSESLLNISNSDFKRTYGQSAAGWRGKKILQRNMVAALGNKGDAKKVPLLKSMLQDVRPSIVSEVLRSLKKLDGDQY